MGLNAGTTSIEIAAFQDILVGGLTGQGATTTAAVCQFNTTTKSANWISLSSNRFNVKKGEYKITIDSNMRTHSSCQGINYWLEDTEGNDHGGIKMMSEGDRTIVGDAPRSFLVTFDEDILVDLMVKASGADVYGTVKSIVSSEYFQQIIWEKLK